MSNSIKACLLILMISTGLAKADPSNPYVLVQTVAAEMFKQIQQDQALIKSDPSHMRTIVEQQLMPHIEHNYAAFSVLGSQAKGIPKEKVLEYIEHFRGYLISTYATTLSHYTDQEVEFERAKPLDGSKTVSVNAIIKEPSKADIHLTFQVRRDKNGQWKAYDLSAEGISLIQTKRAEFAPMIRQQGIDSVIDFLKKQEQKNS